MVRRLSLGHQTEVALDDGRLGLLDRPLADVRERLAADGRLLGRLRRGPARVPVLGELFEERRLDFRGLQPVAIVEFGDT